MDDLRPVGVVGTGIMGSGIVQACAQAGYRTIMLGRRPESITRAMTAIEQGLSRLIERGQIDEQAKGESLKRIETTMDVQAVKDCDIIIEAIVEDMDVKTDLFRRLDQLCPPHTILASDTATLPIVKLAQATGRPDRVVGLHILSPAPASKVVEVVRSDLCAEEIIAWGPELRHPSGTHEITGLMVLLSNCVDERKDGEFNDWYNTVRIPHVVGSGRYLAIYETGDADPGKLAADMARERPQWIDKGLYSPDIERIMRSPTHWYGLRQQAHRVACSDRLDCLLAR